jgi:hypothetical protein
MAKVKKETKITLELTPREVVDGQEDAEEDPLSGKLWFNP